MNALVNSHYDMLTLEPTLTDWSSDNRSFDTKTMIPRLKNSLVSDSLNRKLVIAAAQVAGLQKDSLGAQYEIR